MNRFFVSVFLLVLLVVAAEASSIEREYVILDIRYENGEFSLIEKSLEEGYYPSINHDPEQNFDINLVSGDGSLLYDNSFDPSLLFSDSHEGGGVVKLNETEFYLVVPSHVDGDKVQILDDGNVVFEEEVYDVGATSCRIK